MKSNTGLTNFGIRMQSHFEFRIITNPDNSFPELNAPWTEKNTFLSQVQGFPPDIIKYRLNLPIRAGKYHLEMAVERYSFITCY